MAFNIIDSTASNVKVKGISATAITSGDLVSNNETGLLTKASALLGVGFENSSTAGMSVVRSNASIENNANYGYLVTDGKFNSLCELGDGNIAMIYSGNGSLADTGVNLRIRNVQGVDVIAKVTVSNDTLIRSYRIIKLTSSIFAVAWVCSSDGYLKFQLFNNNGTTIGSTVNVELMNAYTNQKWNIAALSNGNVVFVYCKQTSTDTIIAIYDTTGVLVGSKTSIDAGSNATQIAIKSCSNGDFVVMWYRNAATAILKIARYTSALAQVGSTYTHATYTLFAQANYSDTIVELSNGSIVVLMSGAAFYPAVVILSNTNTTIKAVWTVATAATTFITTEAPHLLALSSGGFALIGRNSQTIANTSNTLMTFDNTGNGILTKIFGSDTTTDNSSGAYCSGITAYQLGSYGFAMLRFGNNANTTFCAELLTITATGTVVNAVMLKAAAVSSIYIGSAILTSSGELIGMFKDVTAPYLSDFYYTPMRRSILGVAAETVTANQALNVLTKGTFTINQNFAISGSFDNTAAVVPGTKGTIVGTSAILRGTL